MNIHDIYSLFFSYFRTKRIKLLYDALSISSSTKIIDVGGSLYWWQLAAKQNLPLPKVTIVNIHPTAEKMPEYAEWIVADGKNLPFDNLSFDIAFCNSVIEHLGDRESQLSFASEIRRVSKSYYVQTPNRRFFVEPHLITPFIHWLPLDIQNILLRNFTVWGLLTRPSKDQCEQFLKETRLLTENEMLELFPDGEIVPENFMGITKSLIAVRKG